jgi:hypothetical protein
MLLALPYLSRVLLLLCYLDNSAEKPANSGLFHAFVPRLEISTGEKAATAIL